MSLTSFELGKLKIAGHVREELDRAGISAQSMRCNSGGLLTPGTARLTLTVNDRTAHLDLTAGEVEECEMLVAGETWYKIDAFIGQFAPLASRRGT